MNLADINDVWNKRIRYLEEQAGQDVWQLPTETIALGTGDCEDYAILKYFTIKWFTEYEPEFVVCKLNGQAHVVVTVNGWVLDNAAPHIVKLTDRTDLEVVSTSTQDVINDPRFAYVIHKMDMVQELIAVTTELTKLGLISDDPTN